ncbi:hypothetical protein JOM56_009475 [Amanita muscaria]
MRPSFSLLTCLCFALLASAAPTPSRSDLAIRDTGLNARHLLALRARGEIAAEDIDFERREASPDKRGNGPPDWHQPRAILLNNPPTWHKQ